MTATIPNQLAHAGPGVSDMVVDMPPTNAGCSSIGLKSPGLIDTSGFSQTRQCGH